MEPLVIGHAYDIHNPTQLADGWANPHEVIFRLDWADVFTVACEQLDIDPDNLTLDDLVFIKHKVVEAMWEQFEFVAREVTCQAMVFRPGP